MRLNNFLHFCILAVVCANEYVVTRRSVELEWTSRIESKSISMNKLVDPIKSLRKIVREIQRRRENVKDSPTFSIVEEGFHAGYGVHWLTCVESQCVSKLSIILPLESGYNEE